MNKEIYFVVSDQDQPFKLCFNVEEAKECDAGYIDSLDKNGELVANYIWDTNACEYVQELNWKHS